MTLLRRSFFPDFYLAGKLRKNSSSIHNNFSAFHRLNSLILMFINEDQVFRYEISAPRIHGNGWHRDNIPEGLQERLEILDRIMLEYDEFPVIIRDA